MKPTENICRSKRRGFAYISLLAVMIIAAAFTFAICAEQKTAVMLVSQAEKIYELRTAEENSAAFLASGSYSSDECGTRNDYGTIRNVKIYKYTKETASLLWPER